MPTNTYVALDRVTVGTATPSVTFTGINQGYTDLVLVVSGYAITQDNSLLCRVGNGSVDTGNNYSTTAIRGDGSTAASNRFSNVDFMRLQANGGMGTSSSNIGTYIAHFMNYSNTTTNKTVLSRANQTGGLYPAVEAVVNLWRSTAAINVITVFPFTGASFGVGTTLSLYGIAAQSVGVAKATGGTITYDGYGNVIHTFTSTGTFTPSQALSCDYLVVAGGGGGGGNIGGGGGAGGFRALTSQSVTAQAYTVTVGGGGAGGASTVRGTNGTTTSFNSTSASGGGGGGATNNNAGLSGGSGGGAARGGQGTFSGGAGNTGSYSPVEGFRGGDVTNVSNGNAGGGGGASAAGGDNATSSGGSPGGAGIANSYSGSSVTYAGGGGGGAYQGTGGLGGAGGGGNGAADNETPTAGTANRGGGGGGGNNNNNPSGASSGQAGGSGIVIIRYSGL